MGALRYPERLTTKGDRNVRVMQVHTAYRKPGGEDAVVGAEADLLRSGGHEVTTVAARNPESRVAALTALAGAPWRPAAGRAMRRTLVAVDPDVVHVHNTWFTMSPAAVHALGPAAPGVVMTLHNYRVICPAATLYHHGARCHDCIEGGPWQAVSHRCYRGSAVQSAVAAATVVAWRRSGALDAVDRFIALTAAGRAIFLRAGLPADRIVVRPHGIPDPGPRPSAPSGGAEVLFVGRAVQEKGLDGLLRWWGQESRPVALRVLGDGPVVQAWRDRPPPGVTFAGNVPAAQVREAMRGARALVVPSLWDEPFGLVVVEAMANGLPVVSTGLGGLGDLHGADAGWLAPPAPDGGWDAAAWDTALWGSDGVMVDASCDARGAVARRRYLDRFTMDHALRSLEAIYGQAISRAGR